MDNPSLERSSRYFIFSSVLVLASALMGVVLLMNSLKDVPIGFMTRDPTIVADVPIYVGFISQIGIYFWAAAAAVCFLGVSILAGQEQNKWLRFFLLISGLLSTLLGLDDTFLLHEEVFPSLGIPQKLVLLSYVVFVAGYLFVFRELIFKTEYIFLALALFGFGVSVFLDVFKFPGINRYFLEDGMKLLGLLAWASYFFQVGKYAIFKCKQ